MNLIEIPFERDEGIYNYFGQLILDGKTPYLDFYEIKPPGIFYAYAVILYFFGNSVEGAHTGFMVLNILTIFFLFLTGKKLFDNLSGIFIAASYGFFSLAPHVSGFTTQSEHLITFFVSAGLFLLVSAFHSRKSHLYFFCGVFFGLSVLIKQTAVFLVLFPLVSIPLFYLFKKPFNRTLLIKNTAVFGLGVFSIVSLAILFLAIQGAFKEFLYWTYEFPKIYVSEFPAWLGWEFFKHFSEKILNNYFILWILAGIGLIIGILSNIEKDKKIFFLLLSIFSICTIFPGLRFYGHYWIQILPAMAVLIGAGVFSVRQWTLFKKKQNLFLYIFLGLFGLMVISIIQGEKEYYFNPNYNKILREVYGFNPYPESKVIGDFIKKRTDKNDQIALIGSEPEIYFYTNRRAPTKHAYFTYLLRENPRSFEMQKEFIQDVQNAKPKFLVYFNHPRSIQIKPNADQTIFKWFKNFVKEDYRLVGVADMIRLDSTLYAWNEDAPKHKILAKLHILVYERKSL